MKGLICSPRPSFQLNSPKGVWLEETLNDESFLHIVIYENHIGRKNTGFIPLKLARTAGIFLPHYNLIDYFTGHCIRTQTWFLCATFPGIHGKNSVQENTIT